MDRIVDITPNLTQINIHLEWYCWNPDNDREDEEEPLLAMIEKLLSRPRKLTNITLDIPYIKS